MDHLLSIRNLFDGRLLIVPDYQRGYAWEKPQWKDFLDDLSILGVGERHYHYTGTVVLHKQDHYPAENDTEGGIHKAHHIVDGQQRLTTVVILLAAIRRELARLPEKEQRCARIQKDFLWVTREKTGAPISKLQLNGELGRFFERHILEDEPSTEDAATRHQERLQEAKKYFADYLEGQRKALGEDFADWLTNFESKITNQLKTTLFPVEQESDVGVIFEVMNNRGKPLSELEKVKNYLLYVASKIDDSNHLGREINGTWGRVLECLMAGGLVRSVDEDQLLKTHWLMVYDPNERNWDASGSIKAKFDLRASSDDEHGQRLDSEIRAYLKSLEEVALAFRDAERPGRTDAFRGLSNGPEHQHDLQLWSERLGRIGVVAPFRPLLAVTRIKAPDRYLEVLKAAENFSFLVYRIEGCRPYAGRSRFYHLAHNIYVGKADPNDAASQIRRWIPEYCHPATFDHFFEFNAQKPRNFYAWPGLRYLLYEWEIKCAGAKQVRLSWRELHKRQPKTTIEHVLPQTPEDPYWRERFSEAERAAYTHDIGNLCLTEDNSKYSNKPFPKKRGEGGADYACYMTANLASERKLAGWADWTRGSIEERRKKIISWAKGRWPHPGTLEEVSAEAIEELAEEAAAEDPAEF